MADISKINIDSTAYNLKDADARKDIIDLKSAKDESNIREKLLTNDIPGTTQTVTFDASGNPSSIVHSANGDTVRTDVFVWDDDEVVETRTLETGEYITITTDLTTLETTVSEIGEVE